MGRPQALRPGQVMSEADLEAGKAFGRYPTSTATDPLPDIIRDPSDARRLLHPRHQQGCSPSTARKPRYVDNMERLLRIRHPRTRAASGAPRRQAPTRFGRSIRLDGPAMDEALDNAGGARPPFRHLRVRPFPFTTKSSIRRRTISSSSSSRTGTRSSHLLIAGGRDRSAKLIKVSTTTARRSRPLHRRRIAARMRGGECRSAEEGSP